MLQKCKDGSVRDFILTQIPKSQYMAVLTLSALMLANNPEPQYHLCRPPPETVTPPKMVLWQRKR
jgi:hypothetical protein